MSKVRSTSAQLVLAVVAIAFVGCSPAQRPHQSFLQTVSNDGPNPFGGAPAVEIPDDAKAMSAFLKAEFAMNEGDRSEALSEYEQAVKEGRAPMREGFVDSSNIQAVVSFHFKSVQLNLFSWNVAVRVATRERDIRTSPFAACISSPLLRRQIDNMILNFVIRHPM